MHVLHEIQTWKLSAINFITNPSPDCFALKITIVLKYIKSFVTMVWMLCVTFSSAGGAVSGSYWSSRAVAWLGRVSPGRALGDDTLTLLQSSVLCQSTQIWGIRHHKLKVHSTTSSSPRWMNDNTVNQNKPPYSFRSFLPQQQEN